METTRPALPAINEEWKQMDSRISTLQETTQKQRAEIKRLERDRAVLFGLFVVTAMALGYVLAQGVI